MKTRKLRAFTLIELLMVIAIIGILAGILIPTVGAVKKQAKVAASKAQLSGYANGLGMFKSEYGFYPLATSGEIKLLTKSSDFIETLSARTATATPTSTAGKDGMNRRRIAFLSFSDAEYFADPNSGTVDPTSLADRFGNKNIVLVVDDDNDGMVVPAASGAITAPDGGRYRASVTAYVDTDTTAGQTDNPTYSLWD